MYFLKVHSAINNLNFKYFKNRFVCRYYYYHQGSIKTKINKNADLKNLMEKDVVLYRYDNSRNFYVINALSLCHCAFWNYIAYYFISEIHKKKTTFKIEFWNWLYSKGQKHSHLLGAISLIFGFSFFGLTSFYTARSVRTIILHRGGKNLTLITHKLPGIKNIYKLQLSEISAFQTRTNAKSFVPIKIKNTLFYFLIDIKGVFEKPLLFDFTVGVKRNFPKI